jgi:methyl-accepting chemotaxis protein
LEAAKIAQGNLVGKIRFRQSDNLMDMAESMNEVAMKYQEHIRNVQQCLADIEDRSQKLETLVRQGKYEGAIKQEAEEIAGKCNAIADTLAEIRT